MLAQQNVIKKTILKLLLKILKLNFRTVKGKSSMAKKKAKRKCFLCIWVAIINVSKIV